MDDARLNVASVRQVLSSLADEERAKGAVRFFKTGQGEYAQDDRFVGIRVPELRKVAKDFRGLPLRAMLTLLKSGVHEERLLALIFMVDLYQRSKKQPLVQESVVQAYLRHLHYVNNWDLVDSSAPKILGKWLLTRERSMIYEYAKSENMWVRRVAMLTTQEFIAHGESRDALRIAEMLLSDQEDLIHKAAGWMLREVGQKVGRDELVGFLERHAAIMPRTMLRYAIEKLPESERKDWLGRRN